MYIYKVETMRDGKFYYVHGIVEASSYEDALDKITWAYDEDILYEILRCYKVEDDYEIIEICEEDLS